MVFVLIIHFSRFYFLHIIKLAIFVASNAKVAQLVEHDLPKVGVAGSSPVFRSLECPVV